MRPHTVWHVSQARSISENRAWSAHFCDEHLWCGTRCILSPPPPFPHASLLIQLLVQTATSLSAWPTVSAGSLEQAQSTSQPAMVTVRRRIACLRVRRTTRPTLARFLRGEHSGAPGERRALGSALRSRLTPGGGSRGGLLRERRAPARLCVLRRCGGAA